MSKKFDEGWYHISDTENPFTEKQDKNPYESKYPPPDVNDYDEDDLYPDFEVSIFDDPRLIAQKISEKILGNKEAVKQCALFLYNHMHAQNKKQRCMALVGPSGSGKTAIWEAIDELLKECGSNTRVFITDCSRISQTGYVGDSPTSFLYDLEPDINYIIVFDEFCKLLLKCQNDGRLSGITGEYLSLIQPSHDYIRLHPSQNHPGVNTKLCIGNFSFVFCGAFSDLANRLSEQTKPTLGFNAECQIQEKPYEKEITLDDMVKSFGMPYELAGRIGTVVNLHLLTEDEFYSLICDFPNSPLSVLEKSFSLPEGYCKQHIIKDDELRKIAKDAQKSNYGARYAYSEIKYRINQYLYDHFSDYQELIYN